MKIQTYFKIAGAGIAFSFILVVLATWIGWELGGYNYFQAGEDNIIIKYAEWLLAVIGICYLTHRFNVEIKEAARNEA